MSQSVTAALLVLASFAAAAPALGQSLTGTAIVERHLETHRGRATPAPRNEADQALVDGWPLYRTPRGQAAFNATMATLKATDAGAPTARAFKGCEGLACPLSLPPMQAGGWLAAGRLWVAPDTYVLISHSPRPRGMRGYRTHPSRNMRYFVFHEFHNSSRNTDPYDTISSHSGGIFVPFYMSKTQLDARGRRFVAVIQVAPYDVMSIHATSFGSAGPGIEVSRNVSDPVEPLQNTAGVLVATMVKTAAPHLRVVNHRGQEGLPMLRAYEERLAAQRQRPGAASLSLPFVPAAPERIASAEGAIGTLVQRRGGSAPIAIAERGIVPRRQASAARPFSSEDPPMLLSGPTPATRPRPADATAKASPGG